MVSGWLMREHYAKKLQQREMNVDEEVKLRSALGLYRSTRNGEVDVGRRKFQKTSWKKWNLTLTFKSE